MDLPVLVDVDAASLATLPCCGVKNKTHQGRLQKVGWLREQFAIGLKAKVLLAPGNRQCGYIEYLPGEYAWRGVDAPGWLFIHCVWTYYRQYQHQGLGATMIQACVADARQQKMNGVAVLTREGPWLAASGLFLANGFEAVATAPPDYQILVKRLKKRAPAPSFRTGANQTEQYGKGLTIVRCAQCPHIAKFAAEIEEAAVHEFNVPTTVVTLETHRDAQNAPTPYAAFSLIYDGRLIADHQVSRTRFRNIMRKLTPC